MEAEWHDRVQALEQRVLELEDQVAILRVVNQWGPAVDTGRSAAAGALFDVDGVLESDLSRLDGPAEVEAMVESDGQQTLIRHGCAHVQTAPVITVDGDVATAITYSQVYLHALEGHQVWRVSANQWELRRTAAGWRVTRRRNRVIDGGAQSHEILGRALDGPA
jgi:hypothetical protein